MGGGRRPSPTVDLGPAKPAPQSMWISLFVIVGAGWICAVWLVVVWLVDVHVHMHLHVHVYLYCFLNMLVIIVRYVWDDF